MKRIKKLRDFILINNMLSIIIPLILVGVLATPIIYDYLRKDMDQKNTMIAATIAQRMADFMDDSFQELEQINDLLDDGTLKDETTIQRYLNGMLENSDSIEGFEILDGQGIVKNTAPQNANILGANRTGQPFFTEPKATGKPFVSSSFISQQTGQPTITIAIPHGDGVLVAYLNLEEISMLSGNHIRTFGDTVTVAITDGNGVFISHPDITKVFQREIEANYQAIHPEAKTGDQIHAFTYEGKTAMVSHADVVNADWHVFVYESYDSIYGALRSFVGMMLLFTLLLVLLSRFVARLVFKDINHSFGELNRQTKEIAAGDYHPIDTDNRFDEFDQLTTNFNGMVASVKERDDALKVLAYYDPQTRLPNAAYLTEQLSQLIQNNEGKIAVICFDIHNFKRINDTYGPSFGDKILEMMGARLLALNCAHGFVARINGSNFIRVLTELEQADDALVEIERLQGVLNQAMTYHENNVYLRFHVGIAIYPDDALDVEELLQYANTAADIAKQQGRRSQHAFFESAMKQNLIRNMTLENSMRSALKNNEFFLQYQPQIDVRNKKIRGFEALIRWDHPQLGRVSPLEFIHIAETTGMIVPIGAWVLETACRQIVAINQKMATELMISVNVSPVQLSQENFPAMVAEVLKRCKLEPSLLELEITENLFINSFEEASSIFKSLKAIGIRMSLDDFGTGYSSLAYLKNLPIDTLKIDQAFTRDLLIRKSNENLMESIIMMAHILHMDVIVEGVEELEQLDCLKIYQCDHVQGYYFSRPIDESQLEALLNQLIDAQAQDLD
ncbi:EAL domain-containing protein [Acetobacterium wieringae]|uniref:EAL domain-containing protein n=1 Tax=Acetobacterium wieringae TaxID=52694 RepID=A0A5D0WKM1_9FIRM|nr:EAL domain-containing protein [Acetobacterium wieringae]TYC84717.1 EAL domain-containing protein [Acetobacterium wieringae]